MTPSQWIRTIPVLRVLGALLLVTTVVVAALAFYVQTRHGFRHVIVPLVNAVGTGTLSVRDGFLMLRGTLELDGLVFADATTGVTVEAERVVIKVAPLSLLREPVLVVHDLEVQQATIRLAPQEGGTKAGAPKGMPSLPTQTLHPLIPVAVERGRLEGLTVIARAGERVVTAKDVTLGLHQLGPGRSGSLALQADLRLDRDAHVVPLTGSVKLDAVFEADTPGAHVQWSGSNALRIRAGGGGSSAAESQDVHVDQTFSGEYDLARGAAQASSSLTARRGETALGSAAAAVTVREAEGGQSVDASLAVQRVTAEVLNLCFGLAEDAPVSLDSALVSGEVLLRAVGPRYAVRSTLAGQQLRVRTLTRTTPPMDLSLKHAGVFDARSQDLTLESFQLTVSEGARVRLTGALDHPLTINLDRSRTPVDEAGREQAQASVWSLTVQDTEVAELRPWLALTGRDLLKDLRGGRVQGTVTVSVHGHGETVWLTGQLQATNLTAGDEAAGVGPLSLSSQARGRLLALSTLHLDPWTTLVTVRGKRVGVLQVSGSVPVNVSATPLTVEGSLTLHELPGEALNPVLAHWTPARIHRARLSGQTIVQAAGSRIAWKADLRSTQTSLRLAHLPRPTPAWDVVVAQAGTFDLTTGELRMEQSRVQFLDRARPLITAELDRPMRMNLRHTGPDATAAPKDAQPITYTVQIRRLNIGDFRPRLAWLGFDSLDMVRAGVLDGRLQVRWHGDADVMTVAGGFDVADLEFQRGSRGSGGPMTIGASLDLTVRQGRRIAITECGIRLSSGNKPIATVRVAGSADFIGRSTELTLDATSGDLAVFLDQLAGMDVHRRPAINGGTLRIEGRIAVAGPNQPLSLKATARAADLRVRSTTDGASSYSIAARADLELDAARTQVQFKELGMTLESGARPEGTLSMTGRWPLAPRSTSARVKSAWEAAVTITLKDLDGAPLVDAFDLLPGRTPGPLRVSGHIALAQDQASGVLSMRGRETLGPIRVARKEGGLADATLHVEHDLTRSKEELRAAAFTLTAERTQGVPDHLTASGVLRFGKRPRLELKGEVVSLDAGWYADLVSAPRPVAGAAQSDESASAPGDQPSDRRTGLGAPLDTDAEISIKSMTYRNLKIDKGRLVAKGAGGGLQVTLEPTGVAGGTVEGVLSVAMKDNQPELSWSAKGASLETGMLLRAIQAGREPRFTGLGSFATSGTGRGEGEALKRSLSGAAVFDVTDGKFLKSPLLDFLAKYTHATEFQGMRFDTMHAELRLEDEWLHVVRGHVEASAAALEASGKVGLDGQLDARVLTKVSPALSRKIQVPCLTSVLKNSAGLTIVPIAVTVKGTVNAPVFNAEIAAKEFARRGAGSFMGALADLLRGCRDDRSQSGAPTDSGSRD